MVKADRYLFSWFEDGIVENGDADGFHCFPFGKTERAHLRHVIESLTCSEIAGGVVDRHPVGGVGVIQRVHRRPQVPLAAVTEHDRVLHAVRVVGAVVAYFFDPVVVRLQRHGMSRTWATTAVTILAVLVAVGVATAILPPLFGQIEGLVSKVPEYAVRVAVRVQPMIEPVRSKLGLPSLSLQELQAEATQWAGQALGILGSVASRVAQRSVAIINLFGLLFLTPVVTFYLLRDWPKVLAAIDGALPLYHADTIRTLAHEANAAVAGYVRGQALVCLFLGLIYAVGLSLVGLQFDFVIGLIAGFISFIPYVGTFVGATLSIGMALAQFPPDWLSLATSPEPTGSPLTIITMGIVLVACFAARTAASPPAKMTSTWSCTSSAASFGRAASCPRASRITKVIVSPSI